MDSPVAFTWYRLYVHRVSSPVDCPSPADATVADLAALLAERYPSLFPRAEQAIYLVNQRTGARDTRLNDGDQVLMLQVLAGG